MEGMEGQGAGSAYTVGNDPPPPPPQPAPSPAPVAAGQEDDTIQRTIHVVGIDPAVMEGVFAKFLAECGEVSNAKICGDPRGRTLYGFVEFTTVEAAQRLVEKSGTTVGQAQITASNARSAIRSSVTGQGKVFDLNGVGPLIQSAAYNSVRDDAWISTGVRRSDWGKEGYNQKKQNSNWYDSQNAAAMNMAMNMGMNTGANRGSAGYGADQYQIPLSLQTQQAMQAVGMTPEQQMLHYEIQVKKAYERMGYSLPGDYNEAKVERRRRRRDREGSDDSRERRRRRSRDRERDYGRKRRRRSSS